MSISDPISDLFARIRNGQQARLQVISAPASKYVENVLGVLQREGYIRTFSRKEVSKGRADVNIELKYDSGAPVIKALDRVSTPGRRVYTGIGKIAKFYNGLGIFILSTPKGVLSDREAREQNVGGEVLGKVF
ncbi:MAG TPA: 30S ribosomal protein S8 [Alphaproteobacteria bacterium]|nr:30S ribosomal protein S8 [Rhodospirillaceae bacterium]HRJ11819.1 30S ribosomal protein S8 [Alphaproteobacteria bacterium]